MLFRAQKVKCTTSAAILTLSRMHWDDTGDNGACANQINGCLGKLHATLFRKYHSIRTRTRKDECRLEISWCKSWSQRTFVLNVPRPAVEFAWSTYICFLVLVLVLVQVNWSYCCASEDVHSTSMHQSGCERGALARLLRHHALMHSTYVLSCLDERTACIYIFSSDICAFS